jgi:hypothetical protein
VREGIVVERAQWSRVQQLRSRKQQTGRDWGKKNSSKMLC